MTQVWDDQNRAIPVTLVRVAPCRVVQVKTPESDGYSALQVTFGAQRPSRLNKPEPGHFAKAGVEPGQAPGRAAPRRHRRLLGGRGAHRRPAERRRAGRRHRRQQGQGLRRRHEAPQLQGPGRLPRRPQGAPGARRHRRLRHPVPGVQGHPHGRPHGPPAGDHPEPRGRPGRRRARGRPAQGRRPRPPRRAGPHPQRGPAGTEREAERWPPSTYATPRGDTVGTVDLADDSSGSRPTCPSCTRSSPPSWPARAGNQSTLTRAEVRGGGAQALAPEGLRPGPPGLDPGAALAGRRRGPRPQAPQLPPAHPQEDGPAGAALGAVRPGRRGQGRRGRRLGLRRPRTREARAALGALGLDGQGAGRARPRRRGGGQVVPQPARGAPDPAARSSTPTTSCAPTGSSSPGPTCPDAAPADARLAEPPADDGGAETDAD